MSDHTRSDRFDLEAGTEIKVQVPELHAQPLLRAVYKHDTLRYGHYDHVSFQTALGLQRFRSRPGGRNAASEEVFDVPCVELGFFVADRAAVGPVLEAIYAQHPYEEPVVLIQQVQRARHRPGVDEDNPNKFWNRAAEDWVPDLHQG